MLQFRGFKTSRLAAGIGRDDTSLATMAGEAMAYVQGLPKGHCDRLIAIFELPGHQVKLVTVLIKTEFKYGIQSFRRPA